MDETAIRFGVFFSVLLMMAAAEAFSPRRRLLLGRRRWLANLGIVVLNSLLIRVLLPAGAVGVALWAHEQGFGLFNWLELAPAIAIIAAVILLDLAIYTQHLLFHAVPILWRLHMVHHADRDIDVTTGLRFHPIEIILSMLIKISLVALLGAPVVAVLIFEVVLNAMAMFNHANVKLPSKLDALLRLVVITPDVHCVHHSIIKSETNSNYGFNLSVWDRIFGTFCEQPQHGHDCMTIGLEHLQHAPTHRLGYMLRLPFGGEIGQYPIFKPARKGGKT
ncbi:MAG: sterol desaturase family protein [Mariprofundus sp.]